MKCAKCEHGILDPNWGDWRCKKSPNRVHTKEEVEWCRDYKEKTKEEK